MTDPVVITALSLLVALLSLDQAAVGQVMVSQPIVGGWLVGLAAGDPVGGLAAGAFFQILCLTELPVGASIPPDGSLAGLIGTALFVTLRPPAGWGDAAVLGMLVLFFFPVAYLARGLEVGIRRSTRHLTPFAGRAAAAGHLRLFQVLCLGGVPFFFLKAFFLSWVMLAAFTMGIASAGPWLSYLAWPLAAAAKAVPFAGLGVVAARQVSQRRLAAVAVACVAGALLGLGLR